MKTNEKAKKIWLYFIEIILILLIILVSIFGVQAWARYVTTKDGNATAQVAKWNFQVKNANGQTVTEGPINFPITRTDGKYDVVQEGKLAPGTWGEFQIIVDTTGTEVSLVYDIEVGLQNCPKNLRFYKDSEHTQSMSKVGDVLQIHRYLQAQNASGVFTETVYWNWEFETGDDPAEIEKNDFQDSLDMELDTLRMSIAVTGMQVVDDNTIDYNNLSTKLVGGTTFNGIIKNLANNDLNNIIYFKNYSNVTNTAPNLDNISYQLISNEDSKYPVYMWFDSTDGTIYYYCKDKRIYLNANSYGMFDSCGNIKYIDTSNFDTSKVTNFGHMFDSCFELTDLDISGFDTSSAQSMYRMFYGCSKLEKIDVSGFDTSNVTNLQAMFCRCMKVTSLDISKFNTSKCINMWDMFRGCVKLTTLDISSFDTSKVENMYTMFSECRNLRELDLRNFDTSKVTKMVGMFKACTNLSNIKVGENWTTENADTTDMFTDCLCQSVTTE